MTLLETSSQPKIPNLDISVFHLPKNIVRIFYFSIKIKGCISNTLDKKLLEHFVEV